MGLHIASRMKYLAIVAFIFPLGIFGQKFSELEINRWKKQAQQVIIIRDNWGVPHVYGNTDADAVFGFAYAQAEDAFDHMEDNYIRALGRASEIYGEKEFKTDVEAHAFEIGKIAKNEFSQSSGQMKNMYVSFADGVNYYLYKHPSKKTALLKKIEPWYPLAFLRFKYYIGEYLGDIGFDNKNFKVDYSRIQTGSNAWAIAPSKTVSGNAMLFINPHTNYYGFGSFYEGHVYSGEGWNFSGATRLGLPFLYIGHNEYLGWALTDNHFDKGDLYVENFNNPEDSLAYKYGASHKHAIAWIDTVVVNNSGKRESRIVHLRKTHHGPILPFVDHKQLAVRLVNFEQSGWLDEYYTMTKARSFAEFKNALEKIRMPYNNIVYADKSGNIFYVYNAAIPIRNKEFDWSKPVDGSDPGTEWHGYYPFSELPQMLNPKDGFVQNCNSSPFITTATENLKKEDFPFFVNSWEKDTRRAMRSRELLSTTDKFSFEKFTQNATDTKVQIAKDFITALGRAYDTLKTTDAKRAMALEPMMLELNHWDYISTKESVAMTLLSSSIEQFSFEENIDMISALEKAVASLEKKWDTWKVPCISKPTGYKE